MPVETEVDGFPDGYTIPNPYCDCTLYNSIPQPANVTYQPVYVPLDINSSEIKPGDTFVLGDITYTYGTVPKLTNKYMSYLASKRIKKTHLFPDTTHLPNPAYTYFIYFLHHTEGIAGAKHYTNADGTPVLENGNPKVRYFKYYDYLGNPTIGYGHLIQGADLTSGRILVKRNPDTYANYNVGLTKEDVDNLLNLNVISVISQTFNFIGVDRWNYLIKNNHADWAAELCDKTFNCGLRGMKQYRHLLYAMGLTNVLYPEGHLTSLSSLSDIPFKVPKEKTGAALTQQLSNISEALKVNPRRDDWARDVFIYQNKQAGSYYRQIRDIVGVDIK
jgi:hypothetical protein